tara:strand:- start:19492 stop:20610 length:1119 start_codon:yes stop_codon:yes gene_type:complete
MHRYFFATKDATINSGSSLIDGETYKDKNVGQDEVLEIKKVFSDRTYKYHTRSLIQFDINEVQTFLSANNISSNQYSASLRLYETKGTSGLSEEYKIAAYPISESWDEGVGKESDEPKTTNGVSWLYRKNKSGAKEIDWTNAGTTYITGDKVSQSFSSESPDINMNVTSIVKKWLDGTNKNYGFLLTLSGSTIEPNTTYETHSGSFEDLKFFSRQTNTIYSPKLEIKWDDHLPATGSNTGSLTSLDLSGNTENYLYKLHHRESYKESEVVKFRFGARKRYIDKTFSTSVQTITGSFIPEGSGSYSIIDMATNEDVVPFSAYTTMSCDSVSSYFKQDLNTFEPNRSYKILIKVSYDDNQEIIFDDDFEFILRT